MNGITKELQIKITCKLINECYNKLNYEKLGEREYSIISLKFAKLQKQYKALTNEDIQKL